MKCLILIVAGIVALTGATSVRAQLVNVSLQAVVLDRFGGAEEWAAADGVSLTIQYEASVASQPRDPFDPIAVYVNPGGEANRWRLATGSFTLSGAWETITVADSALWLSAFDAETLTTVDVQLEFEGDFATLDLPTRFPPLRPIGPEGGESAYVSRFSFDTFSGGGLEPGGLVAGVADMDVTVGPDIVPIPEPSTYAVASALLLGLAVLLRRKQGRSSPPSTG